MASIDDVRDFWNSNPLLTGEIEHEVGSKEWFETFDEIKNDLMREDKLPLWIGKDLVQNKNILDVGCGPGYWCRAVRDLSTTYTGIDISKNSVKMALRSAELFNASCDIHVGNAEEIDFPDNFFDHVISEGVIHHTPRTEQAAKEIVRVLKVGGTATISVYYKNILLRSKFLFGVCKFVARCLSLSIKGRGRDKMNRAGTVDDFIRMYDGADNPIGKGYTFEEAASLLPDNCEIVTSYLYFSPLRAYFRNKFPVLNKFLDSYFGLMIALHVKKTKPS